MFGSATFHGYGGWVVLLAVGSVVVLSGVAIIFGRYFLTKNDPPGTVDTAAAARGHRGEQGIQGLVDTTTLAAEDTTAPAGNPATTRGET